MVFYRKYRPQTIDDLDSEQSREKLKHILASADIPHAFLLVGPKGLGKTSTARIIAKVVNCERRKKGEYNPCNECDACLSITNGTNIDVLEIDGASNRGIDEIRDLREKARLAPSTLKKKIYIIDEVHMLTTEAFNALLKTIEEPPDHVMFLFCTTEAHKVPATILSRCFTMQFHRATTVEIIHSLKRITQGERLTIDDQALGVIADMADGGFRDAAKMLEEVSLLAKGSAITKELVEKELRITNHELRIKELLQLLQEKRTKEALQIISEAVEQGSDMKYFLGELLKILHTFLLQKSGITENGEKLSIVHSQFSIQEIIELVSLFSQAYQEMKFSVIPQLPLEIAIIKWCSQESDGQPAIIHDAPLNSSGKPTITTLHRKQQAIKVNSILHPTKEGPKKIPENPHEQTPIPARDDAHGSLLENLIYKTKTYNHSVAAVLRGCKVISMDDTQLILQTNFKFHKERLDEGKSKEVLEKVVKEITGKALKITVELGK